MKTLLDENNVAFYVGCVVALTDSGVELTFGTTNPSFTTANCTVIDALPPYPMLDNTWRYVNGVWEVFDQQRIDAYEVQQIVQANDRAKEERAKAYKDTTDAMFFKAQRGEIEMQEWLDAVQAIKDRYPYTPVPV